MANRAYYACFQAAIAALVLADIRPPGGKADWSHQFVQAQFSGVLIGRRKRFPADLRDTLSVGIRLRGQADYDRFPVNQSKVRHQLTQARIFVETIAESARSTQ